MHCLSNSIPLSAYFALCLARLTAVDFKGISVMVGENPANQWSDGKTQRCALGSVDGYLRFSDISLLKVNRRFLFGFSLLSSLLLTPFHFSLSSFSFFLLPFNFLVYRTWLAVKYVGLITCLEYWFERVSADPHAREISPMRGRALNSWEQKL